MIYRFLILYFVVFTFQLQGQENFQINGSNENIVSIVPKLSAKALDPSLDQKSEFQSDYDYDFFNEIIECKGPIKFVKNKKAVKLAKSNRIPYGIWYNPSKWKITKNLNEDAEISFTLINKDAYAFMINENFRAPKELVTNFVIENLMDVGENVDFIKIEERIVNGLSVTFIRVDAIIMGFDINYFIYIYCGDNEISQVFSFSNGNYFNELEELINGFSRIK